MLFYSHPEVVEAAHKALDTRGAGHIACKLNVVLEPPWGGWSCSYSPWHTWRWSQLGQIHLWNSGYLLTTHVSLL